MNPIEIEARRDDPPAANRFRDALPEERQRILHDAELTRLRVAEQEQEAERPLTDDEENEFRNIASARLIDRLGARLLADVPAVKPADLLNARLDPEGHTILYGTGGSGKGVLVSSWIVELVRGGHRVLILDYENHPGEWARRIDGLGGDRSRVLHASPLTFGWTGRRGPLWVGQEDIRTLALTWGATYLVIDSIVPACGSVDATKPEAASQYGGALEFIGKPALSLAHVTKADSLAYPFGSVFWHNLARFTWSLEKADASAILSPRKHNNYARPGRFSVTTTWHDDLPREVWERPYAAQIADRIEVVLADGPKSVSQIVAELNDDVEDEGAKVKANSVRTALRRGVQGERFGLQGDLWQLR